MFNFIEYVNSLDIDQLKECRNYVSEIIATKSNRRTPDKSISGSSVVENVKDYVTYSENFINQQDKKLIEDEVERLKIGVNSKPGKVANKFLSYYDEPYSWDSTDGPVVLNPHDLNGFPHIQSLLNKINTEYNCELNSVLISRYKCGEAGIRYHDDDEVSMDPSQPICVVSIGVKRRIEFALQQADLRKSKFSLNPSDRSIYAMLPGCQTHFLHRVRRNKNIRGERYCLSFRTFIPEAERSSAIQTPMPVKNLLQHFNSDTTSHSTPDQKTDITDLSEEAPTQTTGHSKSNKDSISNKPSVSFDDGPPGYSPFDSVSNSGYGSTKSSTNRNNAQKYCVIFGHSMTTDVDESLLSRGSRKVVNCSYSGANIWDIGNSVREFCLDNPNVVSRVDKVIMAVGTNDVKYFDSSTKDVDKRFRHPLVKLVKLLKLSFPGAQIIFKCVLPMGIMYWYTAKSVHDFNYLLLDICTKFDCIFFDCFRDFLDQWGNFNNEYLYRDRIHLNDAGLRILCRALKFVIYRNVFNPIMRISPSNYYYLDYDW